MAHKAEGGLGARKADHEKDHTGCKSYGFTGRHSWHKKGKGKGDEENYEQRND